MPRTSRAPRHLQSASLGAHTHVHASARVQHLQLQRARPSLAADARTHTHTHTQLRLAEFGRNALEEKATPKWKLLVGHFWGPMPCMIWAAILIEAIILDWCVAWEARAPARDL